MDVAYSIEIRPPRAVLGEPVEGWLGCRATGGAAEVLTFDHRSLVLELRRPGLPEPALAFPNRYAIEDAGQLIRFAKAGGVERLGAGEELTRSFDLLAWFPQLLLAPGALALTFRLEEATPVVQPEPAVGEVLSGPASVPHLIGHLGAESPALRFRSAELLMAMTANDFGYRADADPVVRGEAIQRWWAWWHAEGSKLPWAFDSDGATFGLPPAPGPQSGLGPRLGGIAYPGPPPR